MSILDEYIAESIRNLIKPCKSFKLVFYTGPGEEYHFMPQPNFKGFSDEFINELVDMALAARQDIK